MTDFAPDDRIVALDVIRGIAVVGIFSVNVVAMAMTEPAYFYPPAYGLESKWDAAVWAANFVLVDGKMRGLFSILFGASMLLVIDRAEAAGRLPARTHFSRMAVLLIIGLIHFYWIWWGDILSIYALVGMAAFAFRKLPIAGLLTLSLILFSFDYVPAAAGAPYRLAQAAAAQAPGADPVDVSAWRSQTEWLYPSPEQLAEEKAARRSPLAHFRSMTGARILEPVTMLKTLWPETLALVLLGMAGLRSGFLSGEWSDRTYRKVAVVGLGIGGAAFALLTLWVLRSGFAPAETLASAFDLSGPFRPVMAVGYAAAIILLFRRATRLRERFAAVGRCAFTNYLGASILGLLVFFDTGLGLYGDVTRAEAWLLVPLAWALMLLWSKPWLERFRHGPLEWLWRSLARGAPQPMARRLPAGSSAG